MTQSITISPQKTLMQSAIKIERYAGNFLVKLVLMLLRLLGIISALIVALSWFFSSFTFDYLALGSAYLLLVIYLKYLAFRSFYFNRLSKTPADILTKISAAEGEVNLFEAFSLDLARSTASLFETKKPAEISVHELGQSVMSAKQMNFIVLRLGLNPADILASLEESKDVSLIVRASLDAAIENGHEAIMASDLFLTLYRSSAGLKKLMASFQITEADLKSLIDWQTKVMKKYESTQGFFNTDKFKFTGGVGREWSFGYTLFLRQFSIDLTDAIAESGLGLEIIGRDKEIKQIEDALSRGASANVILVGNAGVGKHTTVLGFAKKVLEGEVPREINYDHILQINTEVLISGVQSEGEIIQRFSTCLSEAANAGNIIVLIENIDNLFASNGVGSADMTNILLPFLENANMHIIGTTEVNAYNEYIVQNTSLANHFVRVSVEEPSAEELIKIIEDTAPNIEHRTGSIITFEAAKAAAKAAAKYLVNLTEPERTINLLDGAVAKATSLRGQTIVLDHDVAEYVAEKFQLPSAEAEAGEKQKLLNLENIMHESVIGQDEALKAVANAMRRARSQVTDQPKPIGSFLFLGPTGVGKTATAKALARAYFGGEGNMIRFDMSEYQNNIDIYRLIGTKDEAGNLTTFVAEKPFSLLLIDEIEKADPNILNLFLQILDEGVLTDGRGQKISFSNTIIIATSNAGSEIISQALSQGGNYDQLKTSLNQFLIDQHIFKSELLNRFTDVIAFSPLDQAAILEVAKLLIEKLKKTVLANKDIKVEIAPDAIQYLAELGFDPQMGARPMERAISDKVENLLAEKILRDEIKKGESFTITKEMIN